MSSVSTGRRNGGKGKKGASKQPEPQLEPDSSMSESGSASGPPEGSPERPFMASQTGQTGSPQAETVSGSIKENETLFDRLLQMEQRFMNKVSAIHDDASEAKQLTMSLAERVDTLSSRSGSVDHRRSASGSKSFGRPSPRGYGEKRPAFSPTIPDEGNGKRRLILTRTGKEAFDESSEESEGGLFPKSAFAPGNSTNWEDDPSSDSWASDHSAETGMNGSGKQASRRPGDPSSKKRPLLLSLESCLAEALESGVLRLPRSFVKTFLNTQGVGMRAFRAYAEAAVSVPQAGSVASNPTQPKSGLPSFSSVYGYLHNFMIVRAWKEGFSTTVSMYLTDETPFALQSKLDEMFDSLMTTYLVSLTRASSKVVRVLAAPDSVPYFASSAIQQIYDREALAQLSFGGLLDLNFDATAWTNTKTIWKSLMDQSDNIYEVGIRNWRFCPVHGIQRNHDERVCTVLVPTNSDGTVSPAPFGGRIPHFRKWRFLRNDETWNIPNVRKRQDPHRDGKGSSATSGSTQSSAGGVSSRSRGGASKNKSDKVSQ